MTFPTTKQQEHISKKENNSYEYPLEYKVNPWSDLLKKILTENSITIRSLIQEKKHDQTKSHPACNHCEVSFGDALKTQQTHNISAKLVVPTLQEKNGRPWIEPIIINGVDLLQKRIEDKVRSAIILPTANNPEEFHGWVATPLSGENRASVNLSPMTSEQLKQYFLLARPLEVDRVFPQIEVEDYPLMAFLGK